MTLAELGAKLRERREEKNKSIEDVAGVLKLPVRLFQAIESGSDSLPRTINNYHFIKSYCTHLGFTAEETRGFMEDLEGFGKATRPQPLQSIPGTPVTPGILPKLIGMTLKFLMLILVAGAAYWGYINYYATHEHTPVKPAQNTPPTPAVKPDPAPVIPPAPQIEVPAEQQPAPLPTMAETGNNPEQKNVQPQPEIKPQEAAPAAPDPKKPLGEEPAPVLPAGTHELVISADNGNCWIGFEADGKKQQQRTLYKGDTMSLTFADTVILRLGNAAAVQITYDGKEMSRASASRVLTLKFPQKAPE